jgi:predicted nucleotidyltransferase
LLVQLERPLQVITSTVDGDVLLALARADAAFTGRGLHRVIGRHSVDGVRKAVDRLVRQGIVDVVVAGPSKLYSLNREHLAAPHIVALAQLRDELLDRFCRRLASWSIKPAYAALFGSAAGGQMLADSDIDVFIVRPAGVQAEDNSWAAQLDRLSRDGSRWTGNDVRVLEMSEADAKLGSMDDEDVLRDIRDHGIRLAGPASYLEATAGVRSPPKRHA